MRFQVPSVEAIEHTQPLRADYVIRAREDASHVGLRFEVRDEVGTPLATSCLYGLHLHPGDNHFTAEYDLRVLSPGQYSNYFTLFTLGEGGTHTVEDWVPGIQFRLVHTFLEGELEWNAKEWGAVELPQTKLVEQEHKA